MDIDSLLELELDTLWVSNTEGRLEKARTPEFRPPPAVLCAVSTTGRVIRRFSVGVDPTQQEELDALIEHHDSAAGVGWQPNRAKELMRTLGVSTASYGPGFCGGHRAAKPARLDAAATIITSNDTHPSELAEMMDEQDRLSLLEPWVAIVVEARVASVCETSRSHPRAVEAGLWTYEPYRGSGFATAATAAWTDLVAGRTIFYSAEASNVTSQAVARRVGFTPIGQLWGLFNE